MEEKVYKLCHSGKCCPEAKRTEKDGEMGWELRNDIGEKVFLYDDEIKELMEEVTATVKAIKDYVLDDKIMEAILKTNGLEIIDGEENVIHLYFEELLKLFEIISKENT